MFTDLHKIFIVEMCSCYLERDYYWFTLKGIEKKWLIQSSTILLHIRFLYQPQVWFWLVPLFSKQCVKTERLEVFQTMATYKEKDSRNWNELYICEKPVLRSYFVISIIGQHSILRTSKVRCIHMYSFLTLAIKHSALKIFTHISKYSPFNSANSSLTAEGTNKNQPSKPDSFHLVLNKSCYILTDIFIFKLWYDLYQLYKQLLFKSFSLTD